MENCVSGYLKKLQCVYSVSGYLKIYKFMKYFELVTYVRVLTESIQPQHQRPVQDTGAAKLFVHTTIREERSLEGIADIVLAGSTIRLFFIP